MHRSERETGTCPLEAGPEERQPTAGVTSFRLSSFFILDINVMYTLDLV